MSRRRGSSGLVDLIIVAALVVGAAYVLYPQWFSGLFPDSAISGQIVLTFTDGSTQTINPGPVAQQITDMSGRQLLSVSVTASANPTYTGVPTSTSVTGNVNWYVDLVNKQASPVNYSTLIQTGATANVYSGSVSASTIESWNTATGGHSLKIDAPLTFTANYAGASPSSKSGTFSAVITYQVVQYGVTALSVTVTATA